MPRRPKFPFDPSRFPFFYGWWILGVATLGVIASIPGQTVGVSVFNDSLIEATGLSRLSVANAYLGGTVASGLLLPWGGTLLDRLGARRTAIGACVGLAITLVALSNVDHLAGEGASWVVFFVLLAGLFFCLRFCGQGMLTMTSRTMLGRWFERRRGIAAGVSGLFAGYSFGIAPQLLNTWVEAGSWRTAWQQMALIVGLGMGTIVFLFFRDDPESCGLRMDGREAPKDSDAPEPVEENKTRAEAMKTLGFWVPTLALTFQALIITGFTFHIVDLGAKAGLTRQEAVAVFFPIAIISTATGLIGGYLADRLRVRTLVLVMMCAQALGIFSAVTLQENDPGLILGLGVSGGLFGPIATVAFPRFFGRLHLGSIAGAEMMFVVVGSAIGPSLFASSEREFGDYSPALWVSLAMPVIASVAAFMLREAAPPRRG
ncbi:MAG: MFS transporter [Polyangiales bacterium]